MAPRRVCCVLGTRPEAIKLAPVVRALRARADLFTTEVVATGQHREMLAMALGEFGLSPDRMLTTSSVTASGDGSLSDQTARLLAAIGADLRRQPPDLVLAQGDTATVLAAALACHLERVPLGHVEAGLRSFDPGQPFPEEGNRIVASHLAAIHFAPTPGAVAHLRAESIPESSIHLTGNTAIDALEAILGSADSPAISTPAGRGSTLLVTLHRRENQGEPLERVVEAVGTLLDRNPEMRVVWPVHPNPRVRNVVKSRLAGRERVDLEPPLGYRAFVRRLAEARVVLTDSGGVQEEAPSLGTPVVVARETTERPEALETGVVRLAGTEPQAVVRAVESWWYAPPRVTESQRRIFGDGRASERIVRASARFLGLDPGPPPAGLDPSPCGRP